MDLETSVLSPDPDVISDRETVTNVSSSTPSWPQVAKVGDITVSIYHHTIPNSRSDDVTCWTYVSSGLQSVGQPELVITLRRRSNERPLDWSREPLDWFKIVASWGRSGRIIDAFHTHLLTSHHWLGSKNLETITYGQPHRCLPNLPPDALPHVRLHGIALTANETLVAKAYGWTRAIGHYGLSNRWWPYTPWIDRDRSDCITLDDMQGTMRQRTFDVKKVRGVSFRWIDSSLILEIPTARALEIRALVAALRDEEVLALDSCLHPESDFCATWKAGQSKALHGYGTGTTDVKNFAFVVFCPQQESDSWLCLEDGCALLLTDSSWAVIRKVLASSESPQTQIRLGSDFKETLHIDFSTTPYYDHFIPRPLAPSPDQPLHENEAHIVLKLLFLRNYPFTDNSGQNILMNYLNGITRALRNVIQPENRGFTPKGLILSVDFPGSNGNWLTITANPDEAGLDMDALSDAATGVAIPMEWAGHTVRFAPVFSIWGAEVSVDNYEQEENGQVVPLRV